jgi:chromate reductase, NAD(P)H dehydrogenase (quinone)
MITVIQATNRPDSNTEFVSRHITDLLEGLYPGKIGYISMAKVFPEMLMAGSYDRDAIPEGLKDIQDLWMVPAEKFIWLLPEYNGSFPGVLKVFIDVLSVRKYDETFKFKKSMLIGIATGRSGNIRGMDHLTGILLHMNSIIYPHLLPISRISELMDEKGQIIHTPTLKTLEDHLRAFVAF